MIGRVSRVRARTHALSVRFVRFGPSVVVSASPDQGLGTPPEWCRLLRFALDPQQKRIDVFAQIADRITALHHDQRRQFQCRDVSAHPLEIGRLQLEMGNRILGIGICPE